MIKFQENSADNDVSIKFVLDNLPSIIQQCYILEERISHKLFSDIEVMILNYQNSISPPIRLANYSMGNKH